MLYFASLQSVVKKIYVFFNFFFDQIVAELFVPAADTVMEYLAGGVMRIFYLLMTALMLLMDFIQPMISTFAGGRKVLYNGKEEYLLNIFFYQSNISKIFWSLVLISMAVSTYFSIMSITTAIRSEERGKGVGLALGKTLKTMLTFILIPAVTVVVINLSMLVFDKTGEMISVAGGGQAEQKLSSIIFQLSTAGAQKEKAGNARAKYFSGEVKYTDFDQVEQDFYFYKMQFIFGIIAAVFFIYMYICVSVVFAYYLFQIVYLILISPFFVAAMVLDDGQTFKTWSSLFITRMIAGLGIIVSVRVFEVIIIPVFTNNNYRFMPIVPVVSEVLSPEYFPDIFIRIFLIIMCGFSVTRSHAIITAIINSNAAQEEKKVASFARRATKKTAKKAVNLAINAGLLVGAVVAGIATAGVGTAGIGGSALAAKGGAAAAKGAATGAKAGAAAAKAGAKHAGKSIGDKVKGEIKNQAVNTAKSAVSEASDTVQSAIVPDDQNQ